MRSIPMEFVVRHDLPDYKFRLASSGEYVMKCPFCGKEGKFYFSGSVGYCFKEAKGFSSNSFHAALTGLSEAEARKDLAKCYAGVPTSANTKYVSTAVPVESSNKPEAAPIGIRSMFNHGLIKQACLTERHRDNLLKRGLDDAAIAKYGIVSMPQCGLHIIAQSVISETGIYTVLHRNGHVYQIPGVYGYNENAALARKHSAMMIPIVWYDGNISGFQLRNDPSKREMEELKAEQLRQVKAAEVVADAQAAGKQPTAEMLEAVKPIEVKQHARYVYFESAKYTDGVSFSGCENIHFVGDGFDFKKQLAPETVCITEGCLKADVAAHLSGQNYMGLLGVGIQKRVPEAVKWLKEHGTRKLLICYDMDSYENPNVMDALAQLAVKLDAAGFPLVFTSEELASKRLQPMAVAVNRNWLDSICRQNKIFPRFSDRKLSEKYADALLDAVSFKIRHEGVDTRSLVLYLNKQFKLTDKDIKIAYSYAGQVASQMEKSRKPYMVVENKEELKKYSYFTRICTWNPRYKGIDDYLLARQNVKKH